LLHMLLCRVSEPINWSWWWYFILLVFNTV